MQGAEYIALIGDLVASRRLPADERAQLQRRLTVALRRTHEQAGAGSVARPLLTLGDEFQGLFATTATGVTAVRLALDELQEASRPLAVRFGIGIGTLSTPLAEQAIGMDGPCFHRARAALEWAAGHKLPCWLEVRSNVDRHPAGAVGEDSDPLASSARLWSLLACWLLHQRESWTEPQREAVRLYRRHGAWKTVAAELGVSQGAISQRLRAADWSLVRATESALENALLQFLQERGVHTWGA